MNRNKRITLCIIFIILVFLISTSTLIFFSMNEVQAASFSSDIDGINETRYPGYKEKLKQLKAIYPNIKIFYTGLDWNTVIKNERVHSRNLVPTDYEEEWRCKECGEKLYDTGWYCASKEAIEYLMDPRVYLDTKNIFQFQRLDTSVGTLNTAAIKMAAQGSFLEDDENVVAIYNVAKDNNINAFHLVTVPIVMIICMKYSLNIEGDSFGDPVDVVFSDKIMLALIAIYGLCLLLLLYIFPIFIK